MTAWRVIDGGVILAIRVTPKSSRDAVEGLVDTGEGRQALVVRVRAAPSDGAANEAVIRLLADRLDLPRRAVTVVSGETSRLKQLRLEGLPETITVALGRVTKEQGNDGNHH